MRAAALMLALAAAATACAQHQHSFGDAEKWARVFDDPQRDEWQKPHEVIEALKLAPDAVVADIGAGTGYFAVRFAHMLPKGKVYATDVEPEMVKYLGVRAKREGLANLVPVQGKAEDAALPEAVDLALLVDVYHHIDDRGAYFGKLARSFKPGGRLAIIDFTLDSDIGPPPRARIAPEQVKRELSGAGYVLTEEVELLPNQYFLIFKPR
jgi:ubiquinone/menaquinone biosynthesis C-methylase UbiE